MRISQASLQDLVHGLKLIRYIEKYNSKNQRIFDLSSEDINRLIMLKSASGEEKWKDFLDMYLYVDHSPIHSIQFVKDEDEEFVRAKIDSWY
ncbi:hypothetical protein CH375_20175 [Leptospira ellisii]|uniref:Uncharacterized protein n=1 Tax=Leptospira ellisii TaxID=2023197 RepID=A0A2N0BG87_9LEPT|nr:hypothetical protein CH379_17280 [Leptospira ellisii]PKA02908.1 hypothetical protein CH375_20175 [Leptospira ellisii]